MADVTVTSEAAHVAPAAPAEEVTGDREHRRVSQRLASWLPVVVAVSGSAVVAAHRFLRAANTDTLLPTLMSTDRLTWFYWGQDRLANLVPAVTAPIQDVRWNFAAQMLIVGGGFFALLALFAVHHLVGTGRRARPTTVGLVTLVSGAIAIKGLSLGMDHILVFEQLYGLTTALLLVGVTGIVRGTGVVPVLAWLAVLAALMVNPSLVLLAPVVLVLPPNGRWTTRCGVAIGGMVVAAVLATLASRTLADETSATEHYTEFSGARMVDFFADVFDRVGDRLDLRAVALALVASTAVLVWTTRRMGARLVATYVGAPLFALAWTFLFAGNAWVVSNELHPRYFFPLYAAGLLLIAGAVTEVVELVVDRVAPTLRARMVDVGWGGVLRPPPPLAIAASALAAATLPISIWAISRVDVDDLTKAEPRVAAAEEHDVELVVGSYWRVWPTVVAGRSRGIELEGVAARSEPVLGRILTKIDQQLAAAGTVRVLCTEGPPTQCVERMSTTTGRRWELADVLDRRPLVLAVRPASG